jgi:hypothetical protein
VTGFFRRWSDESYRRASRRRRTEEIMGWICVPVIIVIGWSGWQAWDQIVADRGQSRDVVIPAAADILRR